mgnify:CR=1 FL=1
MWVGATYPRFEPGAFDAIYTFFSGIPRRINMLCNRLLLAAALAEEHDIAAANVDATVEEIRLELSDGDGNAAAVAARANGRGVGDDATAGRTWKSAWCASSAP